MRLILNDISGWDDLPNSENCFVFEPRGGSIGRAPDNDLVLSESDHSISKYHAKIKFENDAYFLIDTSANGVFLNGSDQRVERNNTVQLCEGDRLAIGEYQWSIAIDKDCPPPDDGEDDPTKAAPPSDPKGPASDPPSPAPKRGDGDAVVQAFLDAAGLKEAQIPPESAQERMKLFGGLYREIVKELMDMMQARSSLKNEFRMRHTQIRARENNPLKFSRPLDEALEHLLLDRREGFLPPEAAFQEAFQDIKDHQIAMVVGMRAAFEELLRRFDPELLEKRIIKGKKIGHLLPVTRKASCWEFYEECYAEISAAAEDDYQGLFSVEFARAYEDQIARLALLRKKPGR